MQQHELQPRARRRFVATTDSDHDSPIFPDRAKSKVLDGFAYVAIVLDAWSRRVAGYAIERSVDARLALAALRTAISSRCPAAGCLHHSERGAQYTSKANHVALAEHGLIGSIGRRGNPYDNPKAKGFMKTLKVEAVHPIAYDNFDAEIWPSPGGRFNRRGGYPAV